MESPNKDLLTCEIWWLNNGSLRRYGLSFIAFVCNVQILNAAEQLEPILESTFKHNSKFRKSSISRKHVSKRVLLSNIPDERRGVVVITTAQLQSIKPELRFCSGSNHARGVSEIRDGEDLWQWSRLKIRLDAFRWSTVPQKQFIIMRTLLTTK